MAHIVLAALFPLIAAIVLGYVLKQWRELEDNFWRGVEKLNYYILFPAMLFNALAYADIEITVISRIIQVTVIAFFIACIFLYILKLYFGIHVRQYGVYVQSIIRFNSYIGIALVATLFKDSGIHIFAIMMAVFIPIVNIISVLAMTPSEDLNIKGIFLSLIKNPLVMGCIVAASFNYLDLTLWIGMENFIMYLGACCLPLGLITVGAALQLSGVKGNYISLISCTLGRLIIMPVIVLALCIWFGLSELETQLLVLFFALPTASASYVLTRVLGGDSEMMANIISLQTIMALFTLPAILLFIL